MEPHQIVRVTKSFTFEMAHALTGYDGDCRNIHGHSYKLYVTLRGMPRQERGHPKDGMVMDFGELKETVQKNVLDVFDHALALNEHATAASDLGRHFEKIVLLPFQPTCENLVLYIVEKVMNELPQNVELYQVKLFETATSSATWCSDDSLPWAVNSFC